MKIKKGIIISIVVFIVLAIVGLTNVVKAAVPMNLSIEHFREDRYAYQQAGNVSGTKQVWKIVENVNKYQRAIYCINPNVGFGSASAITSAVYNFEVNMKDMAAARSSIIGPALPANDNNYKAMLWLADNLYYYKLSTAADRARLVDAVNDYADANMYDFFDDTLTDSDIDVVFQLALWYFATPVGDQYHLNDISPRISDYNSIANYQSINDIDEYRYDSMQTLYKYLISTATAKAPGYNMSAAAMGSPVTLDNTTPVISVSGLNYVIGPYKFTKNNDKAYNLVTKFYNQSNMEISTYNLLDSNKQPTSNTIQQMIGQNFYISVPMTAGHSKVKIKADLNYSDTSVLACTVTGAVNTTQPVIVVDKENRNYSNEITTNISEKEYEFELLKTVSGTSNTLDGAQFKITLKADNNTVLFDGVRTTTNGKISIPQIKYNGNVTFTIQEVAAPEGFILDNTVHTFVINFNILTGSLNVVGTKPSNVTINGSVLKVIIDIGNKKITQNFDLALRKFITKIDTKVVTNRYPVFAIENGKYVYNHPKNPLLVKSGDLVEYTIRVFNEGDTAGFAELIKDTVPAGLEYVANNATNIEYRWAIDPDSNLTSDYLSKAQGAENLLEAFDSSTMSSPKFKDLKIVFKVTAPDSHKGIITNIAQIAEDADENGNPVDDIDSTPNNDIPEEDDQDEDHITLGYFDLALRKFITKIGDKVVTERIPVFSIDANGKYVYTHPKNPLGVKSKDIVEYTIRVYNEGTIPGFAQLVKDNVPEGLEFVIDDATNIEYRWKLSSDLKTVETDYLSKEQGADNLLKAFDPETMESPDFRDLKIAFKVIVPDTHQGIITNIAEISEDADENGDPIDDIDSTPDNDKPEEDDQDEEHIKLGYFDLALRKFITKIQDEEITSRIPEFYIDENGKYKYRHPKDPILVHNKDIVEYTIRIYNEGTIPGYAELVSDDLPDGITFLPNNETNIEYRWKLSSDGKTIVTDYLSKDQDVNNLLEAFDPKTMESPDYRDVKVVFRVTEKMLPPDRIITNTAEITEDADEEGNPIDDIDSTPDNWKDEEDDIDEEHIKVLYFDLALYKWVSKVIIIEDGKVTETPTGHTWNTVPEPVVKVELDKKKLGKIVVKFEYTIRIVNEGEIEGYCTEISDYIPEGLEFIPEENLHWKVSEGNKITTDALSKTLLKPGESADVKVMLKWKNNENNLGLKVNIAEISKDDNEYDSEDIDSVPDNLKEGEDDIDDAPVMLGIKTGGEVVYITITAFILLILAGGLVLIKKFVIE